MFQFNFAENFCARLQIYQEKGNDSLSAWCSFLFIKPLRKPRLLLWHERRKAFDEEKFGIK